MKKIALAAGAALLAVAAASPAMAARTFTLTATGTEFNINAILVTGDTANAVGYNGTTGYRVTDITGTVRNNANGNNQIIDGLSPVGSYPVNVIANDNILKASAPYFDVAGISFTTATGGSPFNLYYDGGYLFIRGRAETNTGSFTSVTVTERNAVPEPATWAMMIAGFGLVGGTMRRRKTSVAFA